MNLIRVSVRVLQHPSRQWGWDAGAGPSTAPPSLPPQSLLRPRVLERSPSPSSDWSVYRPMEPSNTDTSLGGHWSHRYTIHGWGPRPTRVAQTGGSMSSGRQGQQDEEEDVTEVTVVPMLLHGPLARHRARKTAGLKGRPRGTLAAPRFTTLPTSDTTPPPSHARHAGTLTK
jgi:hypothetical protein